MQIPGSSLILALSTLMVVIVPVHAADTMSSPASARVKLIVSASDPIAGTVTACLTEELGKLKHARLVDGEADWEITVLALEIRSTRGYRGGVAISTVVLPRFKNETLAPLFVSGARQSGLDHTANLWKRPGHYLQVDALDRLPVMCKQVVADFDTRHLGRILMRPEVGAPLPQPPIGIR